jgi:hypothetical protein
MTMQEFVTGCSEAAATTSMGHNDRVVAVAIRTGKVPSVHDLETACPVGPVSIR